MSDRSSLLALSRSRVFNDTPDQGKAVAAGASVIGVMAIVLAGFTGLVLATGGSRR